MNLFDIVSEFFHGHLFSRMAKGSRYSMVEVSKDSRAGRSATSGKVRTTQARHLVTDCISQVHHKSKSQLNQV